MTFAWVGVSAALARTPWFGPQESRDQKLILTPPTAFPSSVVRPLRSGFRSALRAEPPFYATSASWHEPAALGVCWGLDFWGGPWVVPCRTLGFWWPGPDQSVLTRFDIASRSICIFLLSRKVKCICFFDGLLVAVGEQLNLAPLLE
jgi:hypothetical protein